MEITSSSNQGPIQPRRSQADDRVDITRINREGIKDATEDISEIRGPQEPYAVRMQRVAEETAGAHSSADGDRIVLSEEARRMMTQGKGSAPDVQREKRVDELKQQYLKGTLNTRERAERAASSMLTHD